MRERTIRSCMKSHEYENNFQFGQFAFYSIRQRSLNIIKSFNYYNTVQCCEYSKIFAGVFWYWSGGEKISLVWSGAGSVFCWSGLALVPNQRTSDEPAVRTKGGPATKRQTKKRFKLARTKQIIKKKLVLGSLLVGFFKHNMRDFGFQASECIRRNFVGS